MITTPSTATEVIQHMKERGQAIKHMQQEFGQLLYDLLEAMFTRALREMDNGAT